MGKAEINDTGYWRVYNEIREQAINIIPARKNS